MSALFFLIFISIGFYSIWSGIRIISGKSRLAYIFPHYYSGAINYASIPIGITAILWGFIAILPLPETWNYILIYLSIAIGLVGLILNFTQPKSMTPHWYRWLKENHPDIMPLLRQEVASIGYQEWQKRTQTREGLETWVVEVRRKHGLEQKKPQSSA